MPDDDGILCSGFNGFRNRDSETVKILVFFKSLKSGMNIARFLGFKKPDDT